MPTQWSEAEQVPLGCIAPSYSDSSSSVAAVSGSGVGALRKHAGGMFLASDLGGYAAVASIWIYTAKLEFSQRYRAHYSAQKVLKPGFQVVLLGTFGTTAKSTSRRSAKLPNKNLLDHQAKEVFSYTLFFTMR